MLKFVSSASIICEIIFSVFEVSSKSVFSDAAASTDTTRAIYSSFYGIATCLI